MAIRQNIIGLEINPKFVGALFTEHADTVLRVFCFYVNGEVGRFDLPAQENLENLRRFFTKLNMEPTCTSFILDEVVQGRFYVRAENRYWLYTLLAAPGNVLPAYDANLCNLPWNVCWRSPEAEVLEHGQPGGRSHCFAIRNSISEDDVARLTKESKAFTNPLPVQKRRPRGRLALGVALGLLLLAVPTALTLSAALKAPVQTSAPVMAGTVTPASPPVSYQLLSNHQISGPYSAKTIAEMRAGGLISPSALCRPEGTTEWLSLATLDKPSVVK